MFNCHFVPGNHDIPQPQCHLSQSYTEPAQDPLAETRLENGLYIQYVVCADVQKITIDILQKGQKHFHHPLKEYKQSILL